MRTKEEILKEILNNRGIVADEKITEFLSPKPKLTYDPFLLDGMKAGVDLLLSVARKEANRDKPVGSGKICIYGDYDADGVTAATVMACGIRHLTDDWFFYVPSRIEEGYGLNRIAIDKIHNKDTELIITVDCGCVSYDEVEYAKSLGIKVIVTDHHNIENVISDCIVIDPKKPKKFFMEEEKEEYPFSNLAGCGVAFKFLQALQRTADLPKSILNDALDMVAVGTVGDIVPLCDENRTLTKYGITIANSGRRPTLTRFAERISVKEINSESISFGIVPHINAAGRMDTAMHAVELFNSNDDRIIEEKTEKLIFCNNERKRIQETAYENCISMVKGDEKFVVLSVTEMHEGIAGIVAGKLKDRFERPVIIVTPSCGEGHEGSFLKGTGRSVPKVDIYDILNKHNELFERFGGHKSACGFLMKTENLDALIEGVNMEVSRQLEADPDLFKKQIMIDSTIEPDEVSVELAKELMKLAPFGEGNPQPKFIMKDVRIGNLAYMGETYTHARFCAYKNVNDQYSGNSYGNPHRNCVFFRQAQEFKNTLESDKSLDLVGSLSYQVWKNQERVQFIVDEILERR